MNKGHTAAEVPLVAIAMFDRLTKQQCIIDFFFVSRLGHLYGNYYILISLDGWRVEKIKAP